MTEEQKSNYIDIIKNDIKKLFNLQENKASNAEIIENIKNDVSFTGPNLWILIFAIIICSVGLDINSTAVIIGGMLISPLMGPILGIGLGISRNDIQLIKKALHNLSIAVVLSIVTSTLYFYISPLHKIQSELLSRTSPAFWDVIIAFSGGIVGIVAYTREVKNNVIPGVAIATALMPPLSTAGFGLATGNFQFFFGALYLFFINSIFIATGTYIVIRILKIRRKKYIEPKIEKRAQRIIFALILILVIPSIFTAINMVKQTRFEQKANEFIQNELNLEKTIVLSQKIKYNNPKKIEVVLFGEIIDTTKIHNLQTSLKSYTLDGTELIIKQGIARDINLASSIKNDLKADMLEHIYENNNKALIQKNDSIAALKTKLSKYENISSMLLDIGKEAKFHYPKLVSLSINNSPVFNIDSNKVDTIPTVLAIFRKKQTEAQNENLKSWLKLRLKIDTVQFVQKYTSK